MCVLRKCAGTRGVGSAESVKLKQVGAAFPVRKAAQLTVKILNGETKNGNKEGEEGENDETPILKAYASERIENGTNLIMMLNIRTKSQLGRRLNCP